ALDVRGDHVVDLVAADPNAAADDDVVERDDGGLARAAADVYDHVPARARDGHARADGRGQRLGDQMRLPRARLEGRVDHGAALDAGDPHGNADHDAGLEQMEAAA